MFSLMEMLIDLKTVLGDDESWESCESVKSLMSHLPHYFISACRHCFHFSIHV
ncbi:hypothetical protein FKM82_002062 [Ascaphus truei]